METAGARLAPREGRGGQPASPHSPQHLLGTQSPLPTTAVAVSFQYPRTPNGLFSGFPCTFQRGIFLAVLSLILFLFPAPTCVSILHTCSCPMAWSRLCLSPTLGKHPVLPYSQNQKCRDRQNSSPSSNREENQHMVTKSRAHQGAPLKRGFWGFFRQTTTRYLKKQPTKPSWCGVRDRGVMPLLQTSALNEAWRLNDARFSSSPWWKICQRLAVQKLDTSASYVQDKDTSGLPLKPKFW